MAVKNDSGFMIVVDTREQLPYFGGSKAEVVPTVVAGLQTGDYSVNGYTEQVAVERKELDDLIGCLCQGRERFERELARAMELERFWVVVEANFSDVHEGYYRSQMHPRAAVESLCAFQARYGTCIMWAGNRDLGERLAYSLLKKYWREKQKQALTEPGESVTL